MIDNIVIMLDTEFLREFGLNIKHYRLKQNITQAKLSELLNMSEHRISQIENGKCNLTLKTVNKLANVLNTNAIKFFDF